MTSILDKAEGLFTAIVTPIQADGSVWPGKIAAVVERQVAAGAGGIVPVGGTGEGSNLTSEERANLVRATVEAAGGRVPVVAGVVTPALPDAIATGKAMIESGADSVMVITPFGGAQSQAAIRDHYKAVADALGRKVMAYDIPYQTGVTIEPETLGQIIEDGSIFALKASNPDMNHFLRSLELAGDQISVMSGDENLFALQVALGAVGGVLACSNLLPHTWIDIYRTARSGDLAGAIRKNAKLGQLTDALYAETNPAPMKAALDLLGASAGGVKFPLQPASAAITARLEAALRELTAHEQSLRAG